MVRRAFLLLHKAGLIEQRKGPNGGAKLKIPAKQIGLGDVFVATEGEWLTLDDKAVASLMKKVRSDAVAAMNEHSVSGVAKRLKKGLDEGTLPAFRSRSHWSVCGIRCR